MTKLILTRFLYIYDEVCISLLTSLLKKQSLDECYFWTSELYLSGLEKECWEFIWFVYYDFYYIDNPYFGDYISKKYSKHDFMQCEDGEVKKQDEFHLVYLSMIIYRYQKSF